MFDGERDRCIICNGRIRSLETQMRTAHLSCIYISSPDDLPCRCDLSPRSRPPPRPYENSAELRRQEEEDRRRPEAEEWRRRQEEEERRRREAEERRQRELEAELAHLKGGVAGLNNEVANARGEVGRLNGELQAAKGENNRIKNDLANAKAELETVKGALGESQKEFADLKGQLESYQDEVKRLKDRLAELDKKPGVSMSGQGHADYGVGQLGQINFEGGEFNIG